MLAFSTSGATDSGDDVVFTTKLVINKDEADIAYAVAEQYFSKFGLRDEQTIKWFTLFSNQYRLEADRRKDEFQSAVQNFRDQPDFINYIKNSKTNPVEVTVSVKKWFLKNLKNFGIEYILGTDAAKGGNGDVHIMSINPVHMIDESNMQTGDVVLVNGHSVQSAVIRVGTWSDYSHAAIYDGMGNIYEALLYGMEINNLKEQMETCNPVAVLRPKMANDAAAQQAVLYAQEITNQKKRYDIEGAIASGISWKAAIIITPLLPLKASPIVRDKILGNEATFFCSEAVAEAYERAGTPIINTKPQDTVPGALLFSPNLNFVGYLKFMP